MSRARELHPFLFPVAALVALLAAAGGVALSQPVQVAALAVLVALLGLPHGALDVEVARRIGLWHDGRGLARFVAAYFALAGLTLLLWRVEAGAALTLFLAMSVFHFAGDWRRLSMPSRLLAASIIVCVPPLNHAAEVSAIFGFLAGPDAAGVLVDVLGTLGVAVLAVATALAAATARDDPATAIEIVALGASAFFLPPLVFFVVYFCLLHSPRHLLDTADVLHLTTPRALFRAAAPNTLATLLGFAVAYLFVRAADGSEAVIVLVFVGLACLTVPHMLLIELAATRRRA